MSSKALLEGETSRRRFLRDTGLAALAAGVATACKPATPEASHDTQHVAPTGGPMGANATVAAADARDAMHEKGIKAFPAKTAGKGAQPFEPKIVGGEKGFEVTAKKIKWETEPGQF